jgi:Transglutaminase-like superfamily
VIESLRRRSRRVARGLALSIRRPRDGWLVVRMLAWRAILPVLKYIMPLPRLIGVMQHPRRARGARRLDREERVATLAERVFRVGRASEDCLELSLVLYRYLGETGADPRLVIAIRKDGLAPGHAWVSVDGVPVHDSPLLLEDFVSVVSFDSGGRARSEVAPGPDR